MLVRKGVGCHAVAGGALEGGKHMAPRIGGHGADWRIRPTNRRSLLRVLAAGTGGGGTGSGGTWAVEKPEGKEKSKAGEINEAWFTWATSR